MKKLVRSVLSLALLLGMVGSAPAASTLVLQDSGNIGEFSFTNTGIISATATISVSVPSVTATINTVNGLIVPPEPIKVNTPLTFTVTPIGGGQYNLTLAPGIFKTVGATVGSQAILGLNLTQGDTPAALPNFFNASGPVTNVTANANPLYDFSSFSNGLGKVNFTFTATSFGGGATSFATLFSTVGSTAVGNGSFSQIAGVPEPASVAMMGLGMGSVGLMMYRRRRRV